jgi:hypothetical protein
MLEKGCVPFRWYVERHGQGDRECGRAPPFQVVDGVVGEVDVVISSPLRFGILKFGAQL